MWYIWYNLKYEIHGSIFISISYTLTKLIISCSLPTGGTYPWTISSKHLIKGHIESHSPADIPQNTINDSGKPQEFINTWHINTYSKYTLFLKFFLNPQRNILSSLRNFQKCSMFLDGKSIEMKRICWF